MWLFKKRKKEIVETKDAEQETEVSLNVEIEEEPIEVKPSKEEMLNCFNRTHKTITSMIDGIMREFYLEKAFSLGCIKDKEGITSFSNMAWNLEESLNEFYSIDKDVFSDESKTLDELESICVQINDVLDILTQVKREMVEAKNKYFSKLLISSVGPFVNKSVDELKLLDERLFRYLGEYKNLDDAADTIYLNSGKLVVKTVKAITKYASSSKDALNKNRFVYSYFLDGDVVLAMSTVEWINLYNKISYCMRKVTDGQTSALASFLKVYNEFELRYIVLMIQEEGKRA